MSQEMPDFSNVKSGSSSTAATVYEVKPGDSLSKIAKAHYGKASDWQRIFDANRDTVKGGLLFGAAFFLFFEETGKCKRTSSR